MQLHRLLELPAARRAMVIGALHRVRRNGFLEEALQQVAAHRRRDPERVSRFAALAVELAAAGGHDAAAVEARLELGNALRILRSFARARSALLAAEASIAAAGTRHQRSRVLGYLGGLAVDEGRFTTARELLSGGLRSAAPAQSISIWINLSNAHLMAGDPAAARRACWRAMTLAEELDEPLLAMSALGHLAAVDSECGAGESACELPERMQPMLRVRANANERLQAAWIEARALVACGSVAAGLRLFSTLIDRTGRDPSIHGATVVAIALDALQVAHGTRRPSEVDAILAVLAEMSETNRIAAGLHRPLVRAVHRGPHLPAALMRIRRAAFGPQGVAMYGWLPPDLRHG